MLFGFSTTARRTLPEVADLIERFFRKQGKDPRAQMVDASEGIGWWFQQGSVVIYIFVLDEPNGVFLRITSPILHFPDTNREAFFLRLLEINRDISECSLAAFQEVVLVTAQRPALGLDPEELDFMVRNVGALADRLDDELSKQFHARAYNEDAHCRQR